jgi:hemerythrin-like metal-binding protein
MALIEWRDEFSLGVPDIDHEHRELIDLVRRVFDCIASAAPREETEALMGELYAAISGHFALEEDIMRRTGYAEYHEHKADHERLLDVLLELIDAVASDTAVDEQGFGAQVNDWFARHFGSFDARLHSMVRH